MLLVDCWSRSFRNSTTPEDRTIEILKYLECLRSSTSSICAMANLEMHAVLVEQLIGLNSLVTAMTKEVVENEGLNESQANLVWLLDPQAAPLPLRQLAARLQCDPSNITLLSAKLEEKGLAKRAVHPQDGRIRTLVLTKAGKRVRDRLLAGAYARSPFTTLGEREQQQLRRLLTKVLAAPTAARAAQ